MCLAIIALGFTSMMFGLIISALVKTAEKTMPLLVMFAIVQVVFTGVLFQLFDTAGRRAVRLADAVALGRRGDGRHRRPRTRLLPWEGPSNPDPLWKHQTGVYVMDMIILIGLGVALAFVVARLLRRHEPEVMRK